MKLKAVAAVLTLLLLVSAAIAHAPKTATFEGIIDEVFDAAVKVAQANWSVSYADRKTGTPFKSRFTVSRTGERSVLWYRFRDQKDYSGQ
jgi:hypothetical protein